MVKQLVHSYRDARSDGKFRIKSQIFRCWQKTVSFSYSGINIASLPHKEVLTDKCL